MTASCTTTIYTKTIAFINNNNAALNGFNITILNGFITRIYLFRFIRQIQVLSRVDFKSHIRTKLRTTQ
jgi:hypothetical protein